MTIGKQLRQAREARNLSLEQVAQATHIRVRYLQALEAEQFELLPSTAQLRGFLRAYAGALKLDPVPLLAALEGEIAPPLQAEAAPKEAVELPEGSAEAIFGEIGARLKKQRELLGLSLEDVERHTHIRMHYVNALESGNLGGLPSPVQGKGMLNNYATFLGLDSEAMLLRFADGLQARLAARQPERANASPAEQASRPVRPSTLRRLLSADFLAGGAVVVFLIGFAIWGTLRVIEVRTAQQATPTGALVAEALPGTPTASPAVTPTPVEGGAGLTGTPGSEMAGTPAPQETLDATETSLVNASTPTPDFAGAPVQVYVVARQRAWMRVTVDGEVAFEGRVIPGSAYPFAGADRIELVTGNGAGLQVYFNQQDLGVLGQFGEIVQRIFTVQGMLMPTPAVPPTATQGPTATPSATPSPTP